MANKKITTYTWQEPAQKPYALYIHGFGSSAKSGTKSSFGRYLDAYEWLSPEVTHDPYESLDILNEWAAAFQPALIAGTSMGGLLTLFVNCPDAIKVAVNPALEIEKSLRKMGYGKHPYTQPRENGETEFIIDEPMIHKFITFRQDKVMIKGKRNIALFSTDDELIGHEGSKKNAAFLQQLEWEILWSDKFGHRCNEQAVKEIVKTLKQGV
ncbi:MAG: hypothetical protein MJZ82_02065 [Paludibacteraceae bacterium]|nr:hypothetical protein [Paludibacteraceae bacterium]